MSDLVRNTRKRARTSSGNAGEIEPVAGRERDAEFWYSDGNIILVARDVEFRVFKGILAEHSPVFRDMFSLPQPPPTASPGASAEDDTCPVVYLSDSPEDLRHVLRVYMPKGGPRYIQDTVRLVDLAHYYLQGVLL